MAPFFKIALSTETAISKYRTITSSSSQDVSQIVHDFRIKIN